jgi:uncharacterized iron-regulated membrane protein
MNGNGWDEFISGLETMQYDTLRHHTPMRNLLLKSHLCVSLVCGLILLVVAITGCALVFELQMDRWLDPSVSYAAPGPALTLANLAVAALVATPGEKITEFNFGPPGTSVMAKMTGGRRVYLDPATAHVLGIRDGEPPSFWVRHIHRELAAGAFGANVVRIASFAVIFQSISGTILWWPVKRLRVKTNASLRRFSFDLHHSAGFFSALFLAVIAATGIVKGYGDALQPVFDRITGSPAGVRTLTSKPGPHQVSIDDALRAAQTALPGAATGRITLPKTATSSYLITMKYPGDSTVPGRSWVVVDRYSGLAIGQQDARTAPGGAQIPIVNRAIHVGGIFGIPTRILAFLTGLALLAQLFTGLVLWRKKAAVEASRAMAA